MSNLGLNRNPSFSSSVSSSRTPSVSSRHTSNGSFSSSVGPGGRPQTSMSFNQSTSRRPASAAPKSRPATAMDNHYNDPGMRPLNSFTSSFPYIQEKSGLQNKKLRAPKSLHSLRSQPSMGKIREVSVSTAMSRLCLDGEVSPRQRHEYQAISSNMRPPPTTKLSHKPSINTGMRNLILDSGETALVLYESPGDSLVAPQTPSHITVSSKADTYFSPVTPYRTPRPSPHKTPYLTKGSNIPAFTAWDVHNRLEDVEAMYAELKQSMQSTSSERNGLEEAVAVYKARSQSSILTILARYADNMANSC
jgi:kinesin family member C1